MKYFVKITVMVTELIFEVIPDKFNAREMCTGRNYVQKWIIN